MLPSRQTTTTLEESRTTIGAVLRSLRRSRRMTQAALAERLGLSQGRLSEVESGSASLSAEQFLEVLRFFNVGLSTFDPTARRDREAELQRLVARYGGDHLMEREGLLVESPRAGLYELIPEVLALGRARLVSALAPVVVRHIDEINLSAIAVSMAITGLWRRLAWLVENIHEALRLELAGDLPPEVKRGYLRARVVLGLFLDGPAGRNHSQDVVPDVLDTHIRTRRSITETIDEGSSISRKWGIVTALRPEDFVDALRQASVGG